MNIDAGNPGESQPRLSVVGHECVMAIAVPEASSLNLDDFNGLAQALGRQVGVQAGRVERRGELVAADQSQRSVILFDARESSVHVVFGVREANTSCDDSQAAGPSAFWQSVTPKEPQQISSESSAELLANLLDLLSKHQLHAEVLPDGSTVSVERGAATVRSPYGVNNCSAASEIVLERVRGLIRASHEQDQ